MFRELISIFKADNPLGRMGENFSKMLGLTQAQTVRAGKIFFSKPPTPEERTAIYEEDVKVNKLERKIRKQVIAHLSVAGNSADVPYSLLLMSLVKDVERIGDYSKNLAEALDVSGAVLPDDETMAELREIRKGVENTFEAVAEVFAKSDEEGAVELIRQGRDTNHRCDALINRIAKSDYNAATTVAVTLATRFYKRIGAHLLNILSGVVMPLHKLDYYDEKVLAQPRR
ncbi:MAG: PhoU domain-containing protein [Gemmatimonadales bacterium]